MLLVALLNPVSPYSNPLTLALVPDGDQIALLEHGSTTVE
jgi:hypothetical protein